jgi:hypothetical protein
MNQTSKKMEVLMGLQIPSIVKLDSTSAMMKLPPTWECLIDVSSPTYEWLAKSNDGTYDWQNSPIVPDDVKDRIGEVAAMYNDALMELIDEGV